MATLLVIQDIFWSLIRPRGGHVMCVFQWLRGLERLGHRAFLVDFCTWDQWDTPQAKALLRQFEQMIGQWWHTDQTFLISSAQNRPIYGPGLDVLEQLAAQSAAVISIAATYSRELPPYLSGAPLRILIEHDPGYTHIWACDYDPAEIFGCHDLYYTVGANVGTPRSPLPTHGLPWRHIWNPVVLDFWPTDSPLDRHRFTTVAEWWGQSYQLFQGQILGPKADEFRKVIALPKLSGQSLEIALDIDQGDPDLDLLRQNGWTVRDPQIVATPDLYRDYIAGSLGEFTCAKGVYVATRSGWFSDRSACYLAAGRPVILQETGFSDVLPVGKGLLSFSNCQEALEALRAVTLDYDIHSRAARAIAHEHFDSDKVLKRLLHDAGIS
jgi:hypothetical protein